MPETTGVTVDADARETLKVLALGGALGDRAKVSCAALGDQLGVSTQTASRRLQALEETGLLERELVSDGQLVRATADGERVLQREYADYRRLFEEHSDVTLTGRVTTGMGEGKHYISLPGYMTQFEERLGYTPFAGTLNVELDDESVRARGGLDRIDPIRVDGWEDDERTYGPVFCWPVRVARHEETYETVHLIAPERTHHGQDKVELIAPDRLRDELELEDGQEVTVHVEEAD